MCFSRRAWAIGVALVWVAGCGRGTGIGPHAVCGNGVLEGTEECDATALAGQSCASLNLGSGSLGCTEECAFDVSGCSTQAVCGNGAREYPEACDGADLGGAACADLGFESGFLACDSACGFDTSGCEGGGTCGDGVAEAAEECDGGDLRGATCETLGLGDGSLSCGSSCLLDVSGCSSQAQCGDGQVSYPEVCDGVLLGGRTCADEGFYGGTLACGADCLSFDPSGCQGRCGDAEVNGPEVCDGTRLAGETCRSLGYYGGSLACDEGCLSYDLTGCDGQCGDGVVNGPEACDPPDFGADSCQARGFYGGTLFCSADCGTVNNSTCVGFCGDGTINGPEACDGMDVGSATCEGLGLEGTLRCLPDCSDINPASCIVTDVRINEVSLAFPDAIELLNTGSTDIDLGGWLVEWSGYDNGSRTSGQLPLPPYVLAPGDRVVLEDDYYHQSGDPPTVDLGAGTIVFHVNIPWLDDPGAVSLFDLNGDPVDFVRWGGADFDPPTGAFWSDTPDFVVANANDGISLSRVPDGLDTDTAADWCRARATLGQANGACLQNTHPPGTLLISELEDQGQLDLVEIYNPTSAPVDLDGFTLVAQYGNTADYEVLPVFTLSPGAYVEVRDDTGGNPPHADTNGVIHIPNLDLVGSAGALWLLEPELGEGVDFVRWGSSQSDPASPDDWTSPAGAVPGMSNGVSLGRSSLTDTDTAADWCLQAPSFGAANGTCN